MCLKAKGKAKKCIFPANKIHDSENFRYDVEWLARPRLWNITSAPGLHKSHMHAILDHTDRLSIAN